MSLRSMLDRWQLRRDARAARREALYAIMLEDATEDILQERAMLIKKKRKSDEFDKQVADMKAPGHMNEQVAHDLEVERNKRFG